MSMSINVKLDQKQIKALTKKLDSKVKQAQAKISTNIATARTLAIEEVKTKIDEDSAEYAGMHPESLERPSDHIAFKRFQQPSGSNPLWIVEVAPRDMVGMFIMHGTVEHDIPVEGNSTTPMPMRYPLEGTVAISTAVDHPGIQDPIAKGVEQHLHLALRRNIAAIRML